jgi:membrane protease YdiL (CAAX protease family)
MAQRLEFAVDGLLILAVVVSIGAWIAVGRRRAVAGQPLLEPQAQREPFWSLAEFIVCFGLWLVCSLAALATAQRYLAGRIPAAETAEAGQRLSATTEGITALHLGGSVASLVVLVSLLAWMGLSRRELFERWGLWPRWSDLRLGMIASLFILPPVLLLGTLVGTVVEYEHPTLDAIEANPTVTVFLALTFSAVIVAPLFEEFMFRALLQGGLQKIARRLDIARQAILQEQEPEEIPEVLSGDEVAASSWRPVVLSSAVFALVHIGQGAAPVPLFFMALGLGYVYRQSGRLWPCITVHFVLNALTMLTTGLSIAAKHS